MQSRHVGRLVVTISSALILALPALGQEKTGKVTIGEDHIVVHPFTKISGGDMKAINDVLKKYDKSFYKLDTYQNGKLQKTVGQLSDIYIDQAIKSELANAQANGESNKTMQFTNPQQHPPGAITNPQKSPSVSPTNPQQIPGAPTNPQKGSSAGGDAKAARELVERLKPILEKYSKK